VDRFRLILPLLRRLAPETAHDLSLLALRCGLGPGAGAPDDPVLATRLWGRAFSNPVGLAAGFDKNAVVARQMLGLGFGFVEVGTVTPRPQAGNPKPRIFRLSADRAAINRIGFANVGQAVAARRLAALRRRVVPGPVGVNLGKNKETVDAAADYAAGAKALAPIADYLVVNVSSPNTPGLRALQGRRELEAIVARVRDALGAVMAAAPPPPLLVKIAPDLAPADMADIAALAGAGAVDGLIVSNTTIQRPPGLIDPRRAEAGGLSGRPLFALATQVLAEMYRLTGGRVPLIGVGGISGPRDAYAKIRAGASLVQLYTALVYEGPGLVGRIKKGLAARLRADGFATLAEAVGADHRRPAARAPRKGP